MTATATPTEARNADEAPLLRLDGVTKRFGTVVANNAITLDVRCGEIHGLLGENGAGKSTLMNVIYGLVQPDEGGIEVGGVPVRIRSPRDALALGIGMVHQHFMLVPDMTVAENVALSLSTRQLRLARLEEVARRIRELSDQYGLSVSPHEYVETLSVGGRQRVEILKLLYRGADLLILDEPTATLTPPEWRDLSQVLLGLARQGKGIIFITHKLDELFGIADRCTVLRDGQVVGTTRVAETDKATLARMMVGRDVVLRNERHRLRRGKPMAETEALTLRDGERLILDAIDLAVHEHEILGVAGVEGNGQRELVETLVGIRRPSSGSIRIDGRTVERLDPSSFRQFGGAVVPEDRHRDAVALDLSVMTNLMIKDFASAPFARRGILDARRAIKHSVTLMKQYDIRAAGPHVPMRSLSGGNQQKCVLAREIHRGPRFLVAAQPTRGLDVGAAEFVQRQLLAHREAGAGILLISVELDEILSLSDRIAVMVRGRFVQVVDARDVDVEVLGLLMAGEDAGAHAR
jgi:simple sugar transport system ATP-binding protein